MLPARVNYEAGVDTIRHLADAAREGLTGVTLDFRGTERAYPDGMIQIVAAVDRLRGDGMHFDLIAPDDRHLASVFDASGWPHIVNPTIYDPSAYRGDSQMPVRRFRNEAEQSDVVNEAIEVTMRQMGLERRYLSGLEWSLNEISDNVLNHADASAGGLAQVVTFRDTKRIQFVVADSGRGVYASMREGHPELRSETEAVGEALKQGVTRSADVGQGNGLAGALRIATGSGGAFSLASGGADVRLIPDGKAFDQRTRDRVGARRLIGTAVFVEIRTDGPLDLDSALDFGNSKGVVWDYIDAALDESNDMHLLVHDEAIGFGSRRAGRALRTKISNVLRGAPEARIVLNWEGVPLVSSSFADELLGRLFVELGPTQFTARVRSVNMAPVVHGLVDRAIMQRVSQSSQGNL